MPKPAVRPEAAAPKLMNNPYLEKPNEPSQTESPSTLSEVTVKKVTLEILAEKIDACIDSNREQVKVMGQLIKELQVGKKAGKF
jgi:hypothetical protein